MKPTPQIHKKIKFGRSWGIGDRNKNNLFWLFWERLETEDLRNLYGLGDVEDDFSTVIDPDWEDLYD